TASGASARTCATASSPLRALPTTTKPPRSVSVFSMAARMNIESSTISTRMRDSAMRRLLLAQGAHHVRGHRLVHALERQPGHRVDIAARAQDRAHGLADQHPAGRARGLVALGAVDRVADHGVVAAHEA